ncbi:MAG TPA: YgaP-like transmembrane domain [Gemmatimonadales bacterium]|nr:YgaP-like transmembrane domain [Gemmatimonadales bacterium]
MSVSHTFNRTKFSRFINGTTGRTFRLVAGTGFLVVGYIYRSHPLGIASMVWSFFPLSSSVMDWCWISAALGGPLKGCDVRAMQE